MITIPCRIDRTGTKKGAPMKFLLVGINAKYIHSNPAIYSLRAYAGQFQTRQFQTRQFQPHQFEARQFQDGESLSNHIELAEYTINQNKEDILADIYGKKPDVIAFSCYIWNITMVKELVCELHKVLPELPIWLGGPEVSFDPEKELHQMDFLAGIMVGEGEKTFKELLTAYIEQKPYVNIGGIVTKDGRTEEQQCLDLNEIPFFYQNLDEFHNRIIYYESSRGCPFRCTYCLSSIDKRVRFRDWVHVEKELKFFLENKVLQVKFIDRTFNANHEHAMRIWNYIKEQDNGITNFHFEISADLLNEEEIILLNTMRPGLVQLEIGVQSTNEQTIRAINRTMNLTRLKCAVEKINKAHNIHQHLDLIAGLPYEDYESFHQSFNDVYSMKPEQLQLGFLKVLKGAKMHEESGEYDIAYQSCPPYEVLFTKWLSYDDVIKLKKIEAMVEIFYNSNQFRNTLNILNYVFKDSFALYEKLAEFYEEQGYFTMSAKRIYYYEILLSFACLHDKEREELYRELLIYDCYLRENMKTRPEFAPSLENDKQEIREIYDELITDNYLPDYKENDKKQIIKMTHLEFVHYPLWKHTEEEMMTRTEKRIPIVFDYKNRNPLTMDCNIIAVERKANDCKKNKTDS